MRLRVSTKSPLSWRKCRSPKIQRIFGLRSTPANTTHAPLKTAKQAVFAYKEFFCRTCQQKNKNAADRRRTLKIQVFRHTETDAFRHPFFEPYNPYGLLAAATAVVVTATAGVSAPAAAAAEYEY